MKKKILAAAACAAMVLSLTACGKDEEPANGISSQPESTVSSSTPDMATTSDVVSEPAESSGSVTSSEPATATNPNQPQKIDWSTVPVADENDFVVEAVFEDGIIISQYLGKETIVNVPSTINGEKVVFAALMSNENITDINLPEGVTNICLGSSTGIVSVTIPYSVTAIQDSAFYDCTSLASIEFPDSVISIDHNAFFNCTGLESITIPGNLTYIGRSAFCGCSSLKNVTILDEGNETAIVDNAFSNCTSLTSITIPNRVTLVGYEAFKGCTSLTDVTLSDNIVTLYENAFEDCTNIKVTYKGNVYDYAHIADLCSAIRGY